MHFHHPVFWGFGRLKTDELESRIVEYGDMLLQELAAKHVETIGQALDIICASRLCLSCYDSDLIQLPTLA